MKWFYIIVEIKLGLQYEPENLNVNKVCFAKQLDIPSKHEDLKPWSTLTYNVCDTKVCDTVT